VLAVFQNVHVDRVQRADPVYVDGSLLAVATDAADCLGHGRVVAVLAVAEQRGKEYDVVCGLDVGSCCGFVGGIQDEDSIGVAVLTESCYLLASDSAAAHDGGGNVSVTQGCFGLLELLGILHEENGFLALLLDVVKKANCGIKLSAVGAGFAGFVEDVGPKQVMVILRRIAALCSTVVAVVLLRCQVTLAADAMTAKA
jgi:hypothetical protein